jgi:hypothetical protein
MLKGSQQGELLPENKWLSLPKALWLEIYQYVFLDFVSDFLNDKTNFNLVCRAFNQFSQDPDFIKLLIEGYFPILMDSPDFETNPQKFLRFIRAHLGFNLPPIDEPKLFIKQYTSAAMRMGFTYDVVRSRIRNELSRIYNKFSSRKILMLEMQQALLAPGELFVPLEEISEVFRLVPKMETQRDFSNWEIPAHYFKRSLILATEFYNFRALAALFHPSRLTHQGLSGLQWAAAISNLPLLKELMLRKEQSCRQLRINKQVVTPEEDPEQNEKLMAVRLHLATNNLEVIRRCLYIHFSREEVDEVRDSLNRTQMCERVLTWRFDDLFKEMTVETLTALKTLAGDGDFQDALVVLLARNARADLLQSVKVSGSKLKKQLVDCFLRAYKLSLEEPHSDCSSLPQPAAWAATWQAMLDNPSIRDVLVNEPAILIWAFSVRRIDLIPLCLPHGYKLDYENEAHRQCVKSLFEWAFENGHQHILESIMNELYGYFITLLISAATGQYQASFMAVVKNMRDTQKIKYVREMLPLAANRDDVPAVDDLIAHYVTEGIIAALAFELHVMCRENEKLRPVLFKIVTVIDFNNYPFYKNLLFLDIAHWADPRYLENFLAKHINALPSSAYLEFIERIIHKNDSALTEKMMARTLHAVRYSHVLSKDVRVSLLKILAGDLISQKKLMKILKCY